MGHLNISLLPYEYKKQKQSRRNFEICTVAMFIIIGMLIFTYIIVRILSTIPMAELKVLNNEMEIYDTEINSLKKYQDFSNQVGKMITLAENAAGDQPDWLKLFIAISETTPEGLQITEIMTENSEQNHVFSIRGNAVNYETIVLWIKNLKPRDEFADANLQFSHITPMDVVEFEIKLVADGDMILKLIQEVEQ